MIEATDLAWAAGFWDGEGCTFIQTNNGYLYARMSINQKDVRVLEKFHRIVGVGRVASFKSQGRGYWRWRCDNYHEIAKIADLLWPYLGEAKQDQMLEVFSSVDEPRQRVVLAGEKRRQRRKV